MTVASPRKSAWLSFFLPISLISLLGFSLVWYSTIWGAGLISDSFQYIASARSLAAGQGLGYPWGGGSIVPLTQYPPMFSIVLALWALAGVNAMQAARLLNALLFALNIFLVGAVIKKMAGSLFALLGALLVALSFVLIEIHSWALSEPLYLSFTLAGMLLLWKYAEDLRWRCLVLAALAAACALLTRYVGLSFIAAAVLGLAFAAQPALRRRLTAAALFAAISLAPSLAWSLRNLIITGILNNRPLSWHPPTNKNMAAAIDTVLSWFIPGSLVSGNEKVFLAAGISAVALLVVLYFVLSRKSAFPFPSLQCSPGARFISILLLLYIPTYSTMVILSKSFFDDNIGFTDRMLSPLLVSLLVLAAGLLGSLWSSARPAWRWVSGLVGVYLVLFFAWGAFRNVPHYHNQGLGIARKNWHESQAIEAIRELSSNPVYSNSPSSVYLWTDKPSYGLAEYELAHQDSLSKPLVLVIFHNVPGSPRINRLTQGLTQVASDAVASVYLDKP